MNWNWRTGLLAQAQSDYNQSVSRYIENLAPSGIELPNPEYPWEERKLNENTIQVIVHVPASHKWPEWDRSLAEIVKLLEFLEGCFRAVEQELTENPIQKARYYFSNRCYPASN